jgi:hypothetical protein
MNDLKHHTSLGVIGMHDMPSRKSAGTARQDYAANRATRPERDTFGTRTDVRQRSNTGDAMATDLTPDEKRICAAFNMSETAFRRAKHALPALRSRKPVAGLSKDEMAICRATGMSPARYALAAGKVRETPGRLRAHDEVDRAHNVMTSERRDALSQAPEDELRKSAIAELQAFDPQDESTYAALLNGCLYAMKLLNRVAPAYADVEN